MKRMAQAVGVLALLLVLGGWTPADVTGQVPAEGCPELHPLPPEEEQAVRQQAEAALMDYRPPGIAGWDVVSIEGFSGWAVVAIAPVSLEDGPLPGDGDILLARQEEAAWQVAMPGTPQFDAWLERVPEELLIPFPERGIFRVAAEPAAPSSGLYRLPYPCGERAYVSRAGADHDNAIDFLIGSATSGQDWLVAAQDGWVHRVVQYRTACCCASGYSSNWIILKHPNGEYSYYVHLTPYSAVVEEGDWVVQGQPLATEGDVGYSCSTWSGTCRTRYCDVPGTWDYCCEHLHFEVRDNGSWAGARLDPRFEDVAGEFVESGYAYYSGNCGEPEPPTPPTDLQPTCGSWYEAGERRYTSSQTPCFAWEPPVNPGSGFEGYYAAIDDARPDGHALHGNDQWLGDVTAWTVPNPVGEGRRFVAVAAVNEAGRSYSAPFHFSVDTTPPRPPLFVHAGCTDKNNRWQNECNDPAFVWAGAGDGGGSGVQDTHLYWGPDEQGAPDTYVVEPAFDPGPLVPPDGCGVGYLNLAPRDHLGQEGVAGPAFVLRYDGSLPTATLLLADGAAATDRLTVRVDVTAGDGCSGVAEMRLSSNAVQWSGWLPFQAATAWTLPAFNQREASVYLQVRDQAGNVSPVAEDSIYVNLYPEVLHSDNFYLCASLVDVGGALKTSAAFSLVGAAGESWAGSGLAGVAYQGTDGLLGTWGGCPLGAPSLTGYALTHSVAASGGGLRSAISYREGDTSGQVAGRAAAQTSASYQLWSGFWPSLSETVPPAPEAAVSVPPVFPEPVPLPTSTPWPREGGFGLRAGDAGMRFTSQITTPLELAAPAVEQLQVGPAPGFGLATWRPYAPWLPWRNTAPPGVITGRRVYARFRDGANGLYATYESTLFYDAVPPVGTGHVVSITGGVALLGLEASDDHGGVYAVRIGPHPELEGAIWQTYTDTLTTTWPAEGVVYLQFRDRAGNRSRAVAVQALYDVALPLVIK